MVTAMDKLYQIVSEPLIFPIAAALVIGALAYVLSRWSPFVCKVLALVAVFLVIYGGVQIVESPQAPTYSWTWVELTDNIEFVVELGSSTLGMVLVFGAAAFAFLVGVYSFRAMAGTYWEGKFYAYLIWALGGACIVGLADNLLVLLVGWELTTLMLFLMINQGRPGAAKGGAKTYGILGFADACLLLAVVLLACSEGGTANLSLSRGAVSVAEMGTTGYVVYILIMIAALAKAGAIPLHTWIPSVAEDAPTPVMALLPAAVDKLLGIYLLAVLALRMFTPDWAMQVVMMIVGAVTIIAAVLMAMVQHNLKRLLSFHAVSQVGYMVLGIGTGTTIGVIGGLFHMINNAIYKSNLFLMSGTVGRAVGSDDMEDMGGLARYLPVTFVCSAISAAAISGVPPFNGFVSKWLVYQGALQVSGRGLAMVLVVAAVFGSALTLASFVKVIYSAFLAPAPKQAAYVSRRPRESFFLVAPMIVLAGACVLLGLWPQLATQYILAPAIAGAALTGEGVTATKYIVDTGTLGLWSPSQATGLILIGIMMGFVFVWIWAGWKKIRVVRPFLGGEVPAATDDRFRTTGTYFYDTISKLPVIGPLLKHGQAGAMDLYHWAEKYGRTLVELLRAQHTGLISLYVSWVLVGLTVMVVYLLLTVET